ncbi:tissue inhibitor of metalloproteinase [Phlebotomus papatasi]|uniref:tissue inhibitor of metalloproteinase n=1 Tax=Phlebotomus papatasi TaxID=29031 RepID=UPI0024838271|nr:tissue inhibitor of metalloproteinase [Phlebotomus papatasi]
MEIKNIFIFCVIAFFGLALLPTSTEACSCAPEHPQTQICNAEFAIIARVLGRYIRYANKQVVYKLQVWKTYKAKDREPQDLKVRRIVTSSMSDSSCGVNLKPGKTYAIAARRSHINICDFVKEYKKLTVVERRGIAMAYKKGCSCEIQPCFTNNCPPMEGTCNWSFMSPCETNYGVCIPSRGTFTPDGKPTKCHWKRSSPYMSCIMAP